jgi:eukaryotic-like serine/threonine-protein kinase
MMFGGTSRFEVLRLLGTGGMGSVYLALDRHLQAQVALKTLNRADGVDLFRFKREFRSLADLRHANLVTLYELFSEGELWYFTMEHVRGVPLDRYLRPDPAVSPSGELLRSTLRQLCEGVCAIHAADCVHRDLKPPNVLVTESGRVVILDFGLAKQASSNSLSGAGITGTPAYMAPEQVLEKPCLPAADWYDVGSMLC